MKKLMVLAVAVGAFAGIQAISATPASATGWCGWGYAGCCGARYYRPAGACCARHYRVVRYYRVVKRRHCCR